MTDLVMRCGVHGGSRSEEKVMPNDTIKVNAGGAFHRPSTEETFGDRIPANGFNESNATPNQ